MRVLVAGNNRQRVGSIHHILGTDDRFEVLADSPGGDTAVDRARSADIIIDRDIHGRGWLGTVSKLVGTARSPLIVVVTPIDKKAAPEAARLEGVDDIIFWPVDASALGDRLAVL